MREMYLDRYEAYCQEMLGLTPKQSTFVVEHIKRASRTKDQRAATEAAKEAGYVQPLSNAIKLLGKKKIVAAIKGFAEFELLQKLEAGKRRAGLAH